MKIIRISQQSTALHNLIIFSSESYMKSTMNKAPEPPKQSAIKVIPIILIRSVIIVVNDIIPPILKSNLELALMFYTVLDILD